MKLEDLPEFAKPYKKRGYDVRLSRGTYQLLRISSKRVEGKSYPVLVQEYIGIIKEDGTLRRKASPSPGTVVFQEFGLSDFLMKRYGRMLRRSIFNGTEEFKRPLVCLAILSYVLGSVSDIAIKRCRLTSGLNADELAYIRKKDIKRVQRLRMKIASEQEALLGDDLADFELLMRLCVVDPASAATPEYPQEALVILEKHGVKV